MPGERKRRALGVIFMVELRGWLRGPAAGNRRTLEVQMREAMEYFGVHLPESHLPAHTKSVHMEWLDVLREEGTKVPFDISRLLTGLTPQGIEMQRISIPAVHEGQVFPVVEKEYNIFIENAASIGDGDLPLHEDRVQRLDLDMEVLELVRAKEVRRIRAYRLIKTVPGSLTG